LGTFLDLTIPYLSIFARHFDILKPFIGCISGLLFSVLITAVITDAIKDGVGRPRPDFFWRCFPDGKGVGFQFY